MKRVSWVLLCAALGASAAGAQDPIPKDLKDSLRRFKETAQAGPQATRDDPVSPSLSPDDLLIRDSDTFVPPKTLTPAQVSEDLDLLNYALRRGYGGRKFVDQRVFETALRKVAEFKGISGGSIATAEFCERLTDILWPIPDRHMGVGVVGKMDAGTAARIAKLEVGRVGKNFSTQDKRPWEVGSVQVAGKSVPVVAITAFPPAQDPGWNGFISAAKGALASAPALIFDVRGNNGGANEKGLEFIRLLYGGEPPSILKRRVYSQTPETMALAANPLRLKIKMLQGKGEEVPDFYRKALADALASLGRAKAGDLPAERTDEHGARPALDPAKLFAGPIFVLADRETGSSGESMVQSLLEHPRAKFVGENTAGALNFGNVGYLVLRHSQLYVALATDYWVHVVDTQQWEKTGIPPQIPVAPGEDAFETAKGLLSRDLK